MSGRHVLIVPLLTLVLPLIAMSPAAMSPAAVPPAGFADALVTNVPSPTALAFTPDGRLLIASQTGQLRVYQNGALLSNPALDLRAPNLACVNHERGLLGVAVDPGFATNHSIYLYYTFNKYPQSDPAENCPDVQPTNPNTPVNRVSRFTLPDSNSIDLASEFVLIDNMPSTRGNHNAGDLHFDQAGNSPPHALIDAPTSSLTWKVGDPISFAGHATDARDGTLPATALAWTVLLHHCYTPSDCHIHTVEDYAGAASGSFLAPDHEDLAYIELQLTATDSGNLQDTASVLLGPITTTLILQSSPPGMQLALDTGGVTTPASQTVMAGSSHQLIAPPIQKHRGFAGWADGEPARVRQIAVGTTPQTYTATYVNRPPAASATAGPGQAPFAVTFGATQAADPEGDTLIYHWDFGDGQMSAGAAPTHTYAAPGAYQATLTMADTLGASGRATLLARIGEQGQVSVLAPVTLLPMVRR